MTVVKLKISTFVKEGAFRSAGFSNLGKPIAPDKKKVHIVTRFNVHWQTPPFLNS
jgi:hypothetical protein